MFSKKAPNPGSVSGENPSLLSASPRHGSFSSAHPSIQSDNKQFHSFDSDSSYESPSCISTRSIIVAMLTFNNFHMYLNHVNLSVAAISIDILKQSYFHSALVFSVFYFGFALSEIPASFFASTYGAKTVLLAAVILWSFGSFATAMATDQLFWLVLWRFIIGLAQGCNYPCLIFLMSYWIPKNERSSRWAIMSSGETLGIIFAFVFAPYIIKNFSVPTLFIFSGGLSFLWAIVFAVFVTNFPIDHPCSSGVEVDYIRAKRLILESPRVVPWREILHSRPMWATIVAHSAYNFGYYLLVSWLPFFYSQCRGITNGDKKEAIPYAFLVVSGISGGMIADRLMRLKFSVTFVRKLSTTIGLGAMAIGWFFLGRMSLMSNCNSFWLLVTLSLSIGLGGFAWSGYWSNFIDLSPKYSWHLLALSNCIATIPGVLANISVVVVHGYLGQSHIVFFIGSGVFVVGIAVFLLFGSGETQVFDFEAHHPLQGDLYS